MPETVGFIGLGNMGACMATNLLAAGYAVKVYNRTPDKARPLVEKGATLAAGPHDAATPGGVVVSIVADDRALEAVATDKLAAALGPGGVHLSMSTVLPALAERLAEHHAKFGATYVAAPVFGRPEAAAAGKLWVCTSGPAAAKERVRPVLDAMGQGVYDFGDAPAAAHVVKLAGNFLLTAAIESMAEASALAEKNGIPRELLLNFFTQTLFGCPIYNNYSRRLIDADYEKAGFTMALILKDMMLALQTATTSRVPMPVLNVLRDRCLSVLAHGGEKLDASAVALGAGEDAGLTWFKPETDDGK